MTPNRMTILAAVGAFVLGILGANALADDDGPSFGDLDEVQLASQERDDDHDDTPKDDDRESDGRLDGKRDEDDVGVELRDDDDDDQDTGNREADSGGPLDAGDSGTAGGNDRTGGRHGGTGGDSREQTTAAPAPAPAPSPAPVYDDGYSDDGGAYYGGGGSDYGDS
jgi:hypothetical protein